MPCSACPLSQRSFAIKLFERFIYFANGLSLFAWSIIFPSARVTSEKRMFSQTGFVLLFSRKYRHAISPSWSLGPSCVWYTWVLFVLRAAQAAARDGISLSTVRSAVIPHPLMESFTTVLTQTSTGLPTLRVTAVGFLRGRWKLDSALATVLGLREETPGRVGIKPSGSSLKRWSRPLLKMDKIHIFLRV